jgi:predicted transposase YbfD/YdcC
MLKTHAAYIALIAILLIFGHMWLSEHDARVQAENTIKTLKSQIVTTDAQATQKVKVVTQIVKVTQTPAQVVAAVPQLTDVPLNARVTVDNPSQVSVDALPFVNMLAQAKVDSINLTACQSDLKNTNLEVASLKKKPKFWKRVKKDAEELAIAIAAGFVLAKL